MADQQDLSSAAATNTLTVTAHVIVVPEPSAVALAACGLAVGGYALRRRKMTKSAGRCSTVRLSADTHAAR